MPDHGDDRLTDQALAVRFQLANLLVDDEHWGKRLSELSDVVARRFGVADTEGLADAVTGHHMTAEEAVEWAACNFEDWKAWLTGEMTWERWHEQQRWLNRGRDEERAKILGYLEERSTDPAIRDVCLAIGRAEHRAGRR